VESAVVYLDLSAWPGANMVCQEH